MLVVSKLLWAVEQAELEHSSFDPQDETQSVQTLMCGHTHLFTHKYTVSWTQHKLIIIMRVFGTTLGSTVSQCVSLCVCACVGDKVLSWQHIGHRVRKLGKLYLQCKVMPLWGYCKAECFVRRPSLFLKLWGRAEVNPVNWPIQFMSLLNFSKIRLFLVVLRKIILDFFGSHAHFQFSIFNNVYPSWVAGTLEPILADVRWESPSIHAPCQWPLCLAWAIHCIQDILRPFQIVQI